MKKILVTHSYHVCLLRYANVRKAWKRLSVSLKFDNQLNADLEFSLAEIATILYKKSTIIDYMDKM